MRFFMIILSLTAFSAFACPELAGSYRTCHTANGEVELDYDVIVSQSVVNRVMIYSVTSTDSDTHERSSLDIIADGILRTEQIEIPELGAILDVSTQARCSGQTLVVNTTTRLNGAPAGTTTSLVSKVGEELHQETSGSFMGETVNELVVCN
jgi:hypothetical protein